MFLKKIVRGREKKNNIFMFGGVGWPLFLFPFLKYLPLNGSRLPLVVRLIGRGKTTLIAHKRLL